MTARSYILAIDQGTTSTKALVMDSAGRIAGSSSDEYYNIDADYPRQGWVEYDPEQILETVCASARAAVYSADIGFEDIAGIGLANHGETVIAFDSADGHPIYPAISWQDRRGNELIQQWQEAGLESTIIERTGLRLDSYFSACKLAWIVRNVKGAKQLIRKGRLRLGTSDAWLLWQLTEGRAFVTDVATASRTMLLNLADLEWCPELTKAFGLPLDALPRIVPNTSVIGTTDANCLGAEVPITGMCVDQQAALFGHGCYQTGETKATYGTGCFLLANIGPDVTRRAKGLLTSVGWQINGKIIYVFDGGVYSAGSLVDWLVELGLAGDADHLSQLASDVDDSGGVVLIPAFGGLAAPHWQRHARACWAGMSQSTDRRHLVRSALEAIAYRVKDIFDVMHKSGITINRLKVDGGLTQCEFLMQYQADLLATPLQHDNMHEITAYGVGLMAGLGCNIWPSIDRLPRNPTNTKINLPDAAVTAACQRRYQHWQYICREVAELGRANLIE